MILDVIFSATNSPVMVEKTGFAPVDARTNALKRHEIVLRCFNTVMGAMELMSANRPDVSMRLHLLDDHSSQIRADIFRNMRQDFDLPSQLEVIDSTEGVSFYEAFSYAERKCEGFVYFAPGDLLHAPTSLVEMLDATMYFENVAGTAACVGPCDHETYYTQNFESRVHKSPQRYWRTVPEHRENAFMVSASRLRDRNGSRPVCYTPMPALAARIDGREPMLPFADWQQWWSKTVEQFG